MSVPLVDIRTSRGGLAYFNPLKGTLIGDDSPECHICSYMYQRGGIFKNICFIAIYWSCHIMFCWPIMLCLLNCLLKLFRWLWATNTFLQGRTLASTALEYICTIYPVCIHFRTVYMQFYTIH